MSNHLALVVRGNPITLFKHNGKVYAEGRKGTEYEIRFTNSNNFPVKIVVSVDGLNVTTGDSTWERGYIVKPYQVITIPGWRKDSALTAGFVFTNLRDSYNEHNAAGYVSNVGVIGCKVFKEKVKPPVATIFHHYNSIPYYYPYTVWYSPYSPPMSVHNISSNSIGQSPRSADGIQASYSATMDSGFHDTKQALNQALNQMAFVAHTESPEPLGTGWGADKSFQTNSVDFDAELNPIETLAIYYDNIEGLERRGVDVWRDKVQRFVDPNPFPDGCPPPVSK